MALDKSFLKKEFAYTESARVILLKKNLLQ